MRIWDATNYRDYMMFRLGREGSRTGLRKKLAAAISVHTTFVSQVLKGRAEFSLEQAELINDFFEHTDDEGEFFLLLLLKERAGTHQLKRRFERKINELRIQRINIKKRLGVKESITIHDREKFYSTYIYGAVHVLSAISQYRTIESLSLALNISQKRMREILDFLIHIGILKEEKGSYMPGLQHIHLDNESELILNHHKNWRLHCISHLQFINRDDVHYSACISLSHEDVFRIKDSILQNLKSNIEVIQKSKEETAYVMNLDFYKLLF